MAREYDGRKGKQLAAAGSLSDRILDRLRNHGRQSTSELAEALGVERSSVYRECKELETEGLVISELRRVRLRFFPPTRETVMPENAERIREIATDIREIIKRHELPRQRDDLKSSLTEYFEKLCQESDLERYVGAIKRFEAELLRAVETATKKTDLYALLSEKAFWASKRIWEAVPQEQQEEVEDLSGG